MNGSLNIDELTFLMNYLDDRTLFGIDEWGDLNLGMASLMKKQVVGKHLKVNDTSASYIEMLRLYQSANKYVHIQDYIFALLPQNHCVCKKTIEMDDGKHYLFLMGSSELMFRSILAHPMIAYHASKLDGELVSEMTNCNIVIETFDAEGIFEDELSLQYEEGSWLALDDDMNVIGKTEEENTITWMFEHIPASYQDSYAKIRKEMIEL